MENWHETNEGKQKRQKKSQVQSSGEHKKLCSKGYHNITGRFGVISGNVSDLRTGLPAQTVLKGSEAYHEPMRLVTVIEAPLTLIENLLRRLYKPRELVQNGWILLLVLDPESGSAHQYHAEGWRTTPVALPRDDG